jgi:hypothetical protein
MEFLSLLFSSPLKGLNGFLAFVNLVLALYYLFKIFPEKDRENLVKIKNGIDIILLICLFMVLFVLIDVYGLWRTEIVLIASGNFGANIGNVSSFLTTLFFHSLLISFFLIIWFVLRIINIRKIETFSKN